MAVSKPPDYVTLSAMLLCATSAALATLKQYNWSIAVGVIMIAGSLIMQAALSYLCLDCLRSDALILCGTVYLVVFDKSKFKLLTRGLAATMTLILFIVFILATPTGQAVNINTDTIGRYISVNDGHSDIHLDTGQKPVLFFNPECSACSKAISELIQIDPLGERWTPVQTGGKLQDGQSYLAGKGYMGKLYLTDWPGTVPALVTTQGENTNITNSLEQMIKIIGGGNS
ncbi:hypothetical protein [Desulfotruncus arcticus]|nr:hypothetical protein [Desulfotruncus arcticus]